MVPDKHLLIYDGECKLCNGFIRFLIKFDKADLFRFTPLKGNLAQQLLQKHNLLGRNLDSLVLITNYNSESSEVFIKSDSVIESIKMLGGGWRIFSTLKIFPLFLRDYVYDLNARIRHRLYGRYKACPIPTNEVAHRFIG